MADLSNLLAELDPQGEDDYDAEVVQPADQTNDEDDNLYLKAPPIPAVLQAKAAASPSSPTSPDEQEPASLEAQEDEDYSHLKSLWIKEWLSPELLPYNNEVVPLELELLQSQQDVFDQTPNSQEEALLQEIYKLDARRVEFILQDLLATRLQKLEKYALHNRTLLDRMSHEEVS